ncbi:hypothetical protein BX666DRAFT_503334 [Dichotomocladium elegans]|nr:hypothetical protein BX666DRAFT_503334 [Dichotomocladium elegans]
MEDELIIGLTNAQFDKLKLATIVCSSISLVSSFIVTCVYCVMILYYHRRVDRVSLRCVLISSFSNCVSSIMDIYIIAQPDSSEFCLSSATIMMAFSVLTTTSLAIVGINLLVVFVFGVNKKDKLQYIYYSGLIIYALLSSIVPIYFAIHSCGEPVGRTCWFAVYYAYSKCRQYIWIWHYAFYMFAILAGVVCSSISLWKLIHEHRVIKSGVLKVTQGLTESPITQKHSKIVVKVLVRCVLYTMVPFISRVWNFIAQVVIFVEGVNPAYSLLMFSVVFGCLEGTFVACIFFSDPTVTSIFAEIYESLWRVYVDEYRRITVSSGSGSGSGSDHKSPAAASHGTGTPGTPSHTIAVRRVNVPSAYHSRSSASNPFLAVGEPQHRQSSAGSDSKSARSDFHVLSFDPHDRSKAYIPYRFPRFASCIHCIFSALRRSKYHSRPQQHDSHEPAHQSQVLSGDDDDDDDDTSCTSRGLQNESQHQTLLEPEMGSFSPLDQSFHHDDLSAGRDIEQTLSNASSIDQSSSNSSDRQLAAEQEALCNFTTTQL